MSFFSSLRHVPAKDADRNGKQSQSEIVHLSVNNTGTRVVNTRLDRTIRVWRASQHSLSDPVIIDNAHAGATTCVAWLPSADATFASVGGDTSVKLWKATGALERDIAVGSKCKLVSFSPDGSAMAVATHAGAILVYDTSANYTLQAEYATRDEVNDLKWTNRGSRWLLAGLAGGSVLVLRHDGAAVVLRHTLTGFRSVRCLLVDPRGSYLAVGASDGVVSFFRTADMTNCGVLSAVDQEVAALAASKDGDYVCVAFAAGCNSKVYEYGTMKEVHEIPDTAAGPGGSSCVAWFPNSNMFVYSDDKSRGMGYAKKDGAKDDQRR